MSLLMNCYVITGQQPLKDGMKEPIRSDLHQREANPHYPVVKICMLPKNEIDEFN